MDSFLLNNKPKVNTGTRTLNANDDGNNGDDDDGSQALNAANWLCQFSVNTAPLSKILGVDSEYNRRFMAYIRASN